MMGFGSLTEMSSHFYYSFNRFAKMMLTRESVLSLVLSLIPDNAWFKSLGISHLENIGLYTTTVEDIQIIIRVASSFVKNRYKPAPFHARTLYTSVKTFLRQVRAEFVYHRTY